MSRSEKIQSQGVARLIAPFTSSAVLRNRTFLAVSFSVFVSYIGIGMITPVRVLYAESRGASLAIIGAMATAYLISNFAFQYPVGWLADRWGRKQVMMLSLLSQAALAAIYLPITDPILFVVLRFVEGIAAAGMLPSARALIIDTVPREQQGEAYGIFGAVFSAGFLLGPGIGGLLASSGYASAFIGAIVFRLIGAVVVLVMIRPPAHSTVAQEQAQERQSAALPYRALFTLPLVGAYIIAFGDYLWLGFDLTLTPLWMHDHLGASVALIGIAYMAWSLPNTILAPFGGRLADRKRRSLLILIFGLAQVPLYLSYGLITMMLAIIVLFAIHGAVYAFIQPAVDSHVASWSGSDVRARVQGTYSTIGLIGSFLGASGFTALYNLNFRLPMITMGLGYGACLLIGVVLIRLNELRMQRKVNLTKAG
jgi:MFS family permease